jgi:hypothetical protein
MKTDAEILNEYERRVAAVTLAVIDEYPELDVQKLVVAQLHMCINFYKSLSGSTDERFLAAVKISQQELK